MKKERRARGSAHIVPVQVAIPVTEAEEEVEAEEGRKQGGMEQMEAYAELALIRDFYPWPTWPVILHITWEQSG